MSGFSAVRTNVRPIALLVLCVLVLLVSTVVSAAELAVLTPDNWDRLAPVGKEVDAIYGDLVLRNDVIVAVIAAPVAGRHPNTTVRDAAGAVIDLTLVDNPSDQFIALFPGGQGKRYRFAGAEVDGEPLTEVDQVRLALTGNTVTLVLASRPSDGGATVELRYTLIDGEPYLRIDTIHRNDNPEILDVELADAMRVDQSRDGAAVDKVGDGRNDLFWFYDRWFGQAYGITAENYEVISVTPNAIYTPTYLHYHGSLGSRLQLFPGAQVNTSRRLFPAKNLFDVKALAGELAGERQIETKIRAFYSTDNPTENADVELRFNGRPYAWGRTDEDGILEVTRPRNAGEIVVSTPATRPTRITAGPDSDLLSAVMPRPGIVSARIRDEQGQPIPCKVQFYGRQGTPSPSLGPDTLVHGIHNVYYSENGSFELELLPGEYDVVVSRGIEYDAVVDQIRIDRGETTNYAATLVRSVDTTGWISADFHTHSSPSGDNITSQRGRVLNLAAENIEFAPSTEHNRVDSYDAHIAALGLQRFLATSPGIELTGLPLLLNHQNAFPLIHVPHTHNGGGPRNDNDPEVQIERLAGWDEGSDKLVLQAHPDMVKLFFDRDRDGELDGGHPRSVAAMDVVEVHDFGPAPTLAALLWRPLGERQRPATLAQIFARLDQLIYGPGQPSPTSNYTADNSVFSWLQALNQGYRVPGIVNSDAHANFHGVGWLRNYVKSPTDDPAAIDAMDVVHATEHGNVVMTSGPYLEVEVEAANGGARGTPGDEIAAPGGLVRLHIKVQCANWTDADRIKVLRNGRGGAGPDLRRMTHPETFSSDPDAVVKFDQTFDLELESDTHLIVIAMSEQRHLGRVMGPEHGQDWPLAISNPIWIDVDGDGFQTNDDTLDRPLTPTR